MASIHDLPQELISLITAHLHRRDCKSLRLSSTQLAVAAIPGLVREVHLALQPASFENLCKLTSNVRFYQHIKSVVIFANVLPHFVSYSGWMEAVQIPQYMRRGKPISAFMYRQYNAYKEARKEQQVFLADILPSLLAQLEKLPLLRKLRSTMWWESWQRDLHDEDYGGELSSYDQFWQWLRPHRVECAYESTQGSGQDEMVPSMHVWEFAGLEDEDQYMYRSSVLEMRTIGAISLITLVSQCPQLKVVDLDLGISLVALARPNLEVGATVNTTDSDLYRENMENLYWANHQGAALKRLNVRLQNGISPANLDWQFVVGLGAFLHTCTSLEELSFHWDDNDYLVDRADILSFWITPRVQDGLHSPYPGAFHLPNLHTLSLTSAPGNWLPTTSKSIATILTTHANTLKVLTLQKIWLWKDHPSDNNPRSWAKLLKLIPTIVRLDEFNIKNVADQALVDPTRVVGLDKGLYFGRQRSRGREVFVAYVLGGGRWPELAEEVLLLEQS